MVGVLAVYGASCCYIPLLLFAVACVLPAAQYTSARWLHKERDWGDSGDPSGLGGLVEARTFNGQRARSANRAAITPEAAESSSNAIFTGVYRPFGSTERRSYATAEANPELNHDRDAVTVRTRARSSQDVPGLARAPNLGSGEEMMSALSVGGVALAETYQGAEAVSASDALAMNKGGANGKRIRDKTTMAASQLNSKPPPFKPTDKKRPTRSYSVSSGEGVTSLAMSGAANGKIALAQAESAVAMSQTQTSNADSWQDLGRRLASVLAW